MRITVLALHIYLNHKERCRVSEFLIPLPVIEEGRWEEKRCRSSGGSWFLLVSARQTQISFLEELCPPPAIATITTIPGRRPVHHTLECLNLAQNSCCCEVGMRPPSMVHTPHPSNDLKQRGHIARHKPQFTGYEEMQHPCPWHGGRALGNCVVQNLHGALFIGALLRLRNDLESSRLE